MAVLITGGAGYIGSHVVWEFVDAGEDVVVIDNLSTGFDWAVAPKARLVVADTADARQVARVIETHGVDGILHFAGSIVVPDSVSDPLEYYRNNTCSTRSLIETAVRCGVKHFVFSSTAAVYGTTGHEPVREDTPLQPLSPYGRSKLMSEWMLADAAAAHGLGYTALRYFNVAGADPAGRTGQSTDGATHLIKVACETAIGRRPSMKLFGTDYPTHDGTCVRDYIHVSDLAVLHRLALDRLRSGGGNLVANCGYGHGFSVRDVLQGVERVIGRNLVVDTSPRRPGDAASVVADAALVRHELGWMPRHDDLDFIIESGLEWERRLLARPAMGGAVENAA